MLTLTARASPSSESFSSALRPARHSSLPDAGNTGAHKACCPELFLCSSACKCWVLHGKLQNKASNIWIFSTIFTSSFSPVLMEKVNEYIPVLLFCGSHPRTPLPAPTELSLHAPSDSHGAPALRPPTQARARTLRSGMSHGFLFFCSQV